MIRIPETGFQKIISLKNVHQSTQGKFIKSQDSTEQIKVHWYSRIENFEFVFIPLLIDISNQLKVNEKIFTLHHFNDTNFIGLS